ncbi:MAG: hypothetical protein H6721_00960 [Sandaracinus sp.]|nr:hypothetical protein [Sandaracinus sp.]MCB9630713.1 hypothetical protein [Sandaracinus sp.]
MKTQGTLAHEAARQGRRDEARALLAEAARANDAAVFVELSVFAGNTLDATLEEAAANDALDVIERLLQVRNATGAALRAASRGGSARAARRLLDAGALADERDEWGRHALALAIAEGHDEVIALFVERGLALDGSAIAAAILGGRESLVLRLIDAGAPWTPHARQFALDRGMAKAAARETSEVARRPARQIVELPSRERLRVLALLAHLAWVDDELDPREAALVRGLASRAALLPDERARVEEWLEAPPTTDVLGSAKVLAPEARDLFVELAHRLVDADDVRTEDEEQTLVLLGLILKA